MYQQDYIMRMIREMIRVIILTIFKLDIDEPPENVLKLQGDKDKLEVLLGMVADGRINEAENLVYEMTCSNDIANLQIGLLFYLYLNEEDDEFLEAHDFSREEIKLGVMDLGRRYGIEDTTGIFMEGKL